MHRVVIRRRPCESPDPERIEVPTLRPRRSHYCGSHPSDQEITGKVRDPPGQEIDSREIRRITAGLLPKNLVDRNRFGSAMHSLPARTRSEYLRDSHTTSELQTDRLKARKRDSRLREPTRLGCNILLSSVSCSVLSEHLGIPKTEYTLSVNVHTVF